MATQPYADGTTTATYRDASEAGRARRAYADVGAQIFLWIAWVAAFGVWAFFMSVDVGIVRAIQAGGHNTLMGGVDAGGAGFVLMDVVGGLVVLGVAIAYGAARWATRDRSRDPMTEAATAEIYDAAERGVPPYGAPGTRGDDPVDGYRPA